MLEMFENNQFVETEYTKRIVDKALVYLRAGFPIHFSGPAGTGKTTLAMHVAEKLGHPIFLVHGNYEFSNSDLVGGISGFRRSKTVDNFIHSVWKGEESLDSVWQDGRLTKACRVGGTLVYDEFTRSRPEANNVLLAVLEERILDLSRFQKAQPLLNVHPDFSAIFTSNPEEYAGIHKYQDALRDRMITIDLGQYDQETEIAIAAAKSSLQQSDLQKIVGLLTQLRSSEFLFSPSIRATIMIARICRESGTAVSKSNPLFREICEDVLISEARSLDSINDKDKLRSTIEELIEILC